MTLTFRLFALMLSCCIAGTIGLNTCEAARNTPIYAAADAYRKAVEQFEKLVLRTPNIRSSVERLVDDLEQSAIKLRLAAHDPGRFDRLCRRYATTEKLHSRVGLTFFGDPIFYPGPQLEESWIVVDEAYVNLATEMQYLNRLRNIKRGKFAPIINHTVAPVGYVGTTPISSLRVNGGVVTGVASGVAAPQIMVGGADSIDAERYPAPTRRTISTRAELEAVIRGTLQRRR